MPEGARPIRNPISVREWLSLPKVRRARLTGHAGELAGFDLGLFVVMAELARSDGRGMSASVGTLAHEVGYSARPVQRSLRRLEAGFWIRCTLRSKGGLTAGGKPNPTSIYDILTLPADPRPKLTRSARRAALFPDWRDAGRGVAATHKQRGVGGTDK